MNWRIDRGRIRRAFLPLLVLALAGCAATAPAPVAERAGGARTGKPAPSPATPPAAIATSEFHTVKKGDTLYSIALDHGQDHRDIAAWNGLDNPNVLRIGQQLRVRPAAADGLAAAAPAAEAPAVEPVAVAKPVILDPGVEARAMEVAPKPIGDLKREPKGGKQPYSEQALAQMRGLDEAPDKTGEPAAKPEPKPEPKAEPRQEAKIDTRPDDAKTSDAQAVEGNDVEGLAWIWPAGGKLIGQFSEPSNKGVDIAGKLGDPVLAAADGKVMYVGAGIRGYGNLVIIKHNVTYLSAYAHNRRILVKENQAVGKGQKIAELGNSDADQPKLHFEIRRQGKPVDPLKYLPPR